MAKIAVALDRALARRGADGVPGWTAARLLAQGDGWSVSDVVCTSGPQDRAFEERHSSFCIAIVVAGSFQYRSSLGRRLMTPGSFLLGNPGQFFECGHEHATGDRCISFRYAPGYFEGLAADAGVRGRKPDFRAVRLPPLRSLSPLVAQVCASVEGSADEPWEELGVHLAVETTKLAGFWSGPSDVLPSAEARVTRAVRRIERHPDARLHLSDLALDAGLSRYHFLRTFEYLTGVTPHQYVLRARLREAAVRLAAQPNRVLDIALDCGFGDVSNFNRAFRAEFGVSPRVYRRQTCRSGCGGAAVGRAPR
ncbi:MAG: helix-turn-helix domain-containing protein [Bryobacteraceae bacterium]